MNKRYLATMIFGLIVLGGLAYFSVHKPAKPLSLPAQKQNIVTNQKPSDIPLGSTLAVAKEHSKGTLPSCLSKDPVADSAVRKIDTTLTANYSAFDMQALSGIIDIPAGTNADVNIHSYDGNVADGVVVYPTKYGTYNFTIKHNNDSSSDPWTMTSLRACQGA